MGLQSQSYVMTNGQSAGVRPPSEVEDQLFITVRQLGVC
jgi:hypothetical protein